MSTYLFMDIDGVLIRHSAGRDPTKGRPWDDEAKRKLGIEPNLMSKVFFKKRFKPVLLGQIDLIDALTEAIDEMGISCSAQDIMDIWFPGDAYLDFELLNMIDTLVSEGKVRAFLATNQEKYRVRYLWEDLGLKNHFEDRFFSGEIGAFKIDSKYYEHVHKKLGISPTRNTILFFDDGEDNISISRNFGWSSFLYLDINDFSYNPSILNLLSEEAQE